SASPVLSNMAPCRRTRFTPYLANRRAHWVNASPLKLGGGPLTPQKRTGCWFAEWTNSSPRAAMKPCSPATDSFNQRRSMALSRNKSGGGLKANQFESSAAKAMAAVPRRPQTRRAGVDLSIFEVLPLTHRTPTGFLERDNSEEKEQTEGIEIQTKD